MVRVLSLVIVGLFAVLVACQKQEPAKVTAKDVEEKTAAAAGTAADYAKQQKDEYIARAEKEIDAIKVDVAKLKTKAKTASAKAKQDLERDIKALDDKRDVAERKLAELKVASVGAWEKLKTGVDKAVDDLKQAFSKTKQ